MAVRAKIFAPLVAAFLIAACNGGTGDNAAETAAMPSPSPVAAPASATQQAERPALALFTSLPIFWAEGDIGALLDGKSRDHWAKAAIAKDYDLRPIDRLTALGTPQASGIERLFMAQPRALTAQENVALDEWVRAGGRLVLLADPMLMAHSEYGLGDRRRPEAIAMLSPILARWGLELTYDDGNGAQNDGWRIVEMPVPLPVSQAGQFRLTGEGHDSRCEAQADGLVVRCRIGEGSVLAVADAALLQDGESPVDGAQAALAAMLRTLEAPL